MEVKIKTLDEARSENYVHFLRGQELGNISQRYAAAVESGNEEEAAQVAREYRNALLDACDNMLVVDRPNVDVEAWRTYRQALRDVPEQPGFPMNIEWPEKP